MNDNRYWITNPVGHRHNARPSYEDGETIDTAFGPAVAIVPPAPPLDEWVCDMCNQDILVKFGDEPFPVPMFGSYALCLDHFNDVVERWTYDDEYGEATDELMGPWPLQICTCLPCTIQTWEWTPMLHYATKA